MIFIVTCWQPSFLPNEMKLRFLQSLFNALPLMNSWIDRFSPRGKERLFSKEADYHFSRFTLLDVLDGFSETFERRINVFLVTKTSMLIGDIGFGRVLAGCWQSEQEL